MTLQVARVCTDLREASLEVHDVVVTQGAHAPGEHGAVRDDVERALTRVHQPDADHARSHGGCLSRRENLAKSPNFAVR